MSNNLDNELLSTKLWAEQLKQQLGVKPGSIINYGLTTLSGNTSLAEFGNTLNQIALLHRENEKLLVLVRDMLDSLTMIKDGTDEDDPNYQFRIGLIQGYLCRIGEILDEKEANEKRWKEEEARASQAQKQVYKTSMLPQRSP